jgi:hypothetical protein
MLTRIGDWTGGQVFYALSTQEYLMDMDSYE